jgi:parallel beta-helix repeat protein
MRLPLFLTICLLFLFTCVRATTYYFSSGIGDDSRSASSAQNQATPWKTISKFNSTSFSAGDIILFRRGDVFNLTSSINPLSNGSSGSPITMGAWGTGPNPIFTGFDTVTTWTAVSGMPGVFKSQPLNPETDIKMVVIDGQPATKGRYPNIDAPNGGWLIFESNNNTNHTITDNQLSSTPINSSWVGATIKIRPITYVIDDATITAVNTSTNTITFSGLHTNPENSGYGYIVTNSMKTLDQYGEFYFNDASNGGDNCVYMYFGSVDPKLHEVYVTVIDNLLNHSKNYWTITNLDFVGANMYFMGSQAAVTNLTVRSCNFTYTGNWGIAMNKRTNFVLDSCNIKWCNANGINFGYQNENPVITNCTIENCGYSVSNLLRDPIYQLRCGYGIFISGDIGSNIGCTIINNKVINTGYNGIYFEGNKCQVKYNYVNTTCTLMDDGGGIYTVNHQSNYQTTNTIRGNIVLNTHNNPFGKPSNSAVGGCGIYMDDGTSNCTIDSNFVANSQLYGIFLHNADSSSIKANTVINSTKAQLSIIDDNVFGPTKALTVSGNVFFSTSPNQLTYSIAIQDTTSSLNNKSGIKGLATINNNKVCNPFNENGQVTRYNVYNKSSRDWSFGQWKQETGFDGSSSQTPIPVTNLHNIIFRYATDQGQQLYLPFTYRKMDASSVSGKLTIPPHSGIILIR